MQTVPATADSTMQALKAPTAGRVRAEDLYEFRRYNYADGWDSDDAALGWVDEDIVSTSSRRRLH